MEYDEFDRLTEAEALALVPAKAEALRTRARRLDALHGACQRTFGKAPDLPPLVEALATTPDATSVLELPDRDPDDD
jgi:hypothetical protein